MKKRIKKILREIKEQCRIVMEDRRIKENDWIVARLGLHNI